MPGLVAQCTPIPRDPPCPQLPFCGVLNASLTAVSQRHLWLMLRAEVTSAGCFLEAKKQLSVDRARKCQNGPLHPWPLAVTWAHRLLHPHHWHPQGNCASRLEADIFESCSFGWGVAGGWKRGMVFPSSDYVFKRNKTWLWQPRAETCPGCWGGSLYPTSIWGRLQGADAQVGVQGCPAWSKKLAWTEQPIGSVLTVAAPEGSGEVRWQTPLRTRRVRGGAWSAGVLVRGFSV